MQIRSYMSDPGVTGENRLPARSMLLPAQKRGVTHKNFTESDRLRLLSGTWNFSYREKDDDDPFFMPGYNDSGWDRLGVPSMWQFNGYGTCYYPNLRYCFPYDPPYIHRSNPVGLYRLTFESGKPDHGRAFLRFLGVDNAYFVWLNGRYIGFSKGSRIPAEFDVTDALTDGENLLAVKVFTFSDASYLENQDMLMASGIFRDVMLVYTGENTLWDYTLLTDKTGVTVRYECLTGASPADLSFTLCDAEGRICSSKSVPLAEKGELFLPLSDAREWNAEQPYLYTLYAEISEDGKITETYTKKVGIARSSIDGHFLKMNGTPITLKGVNRHENNAFTGRAITARQIESELKDIKACGLNAIRCSHYTNQPVFYELASELGIYVMDEADCETHGAETAGDQGALNKDPRWFDSFFDRISRMYFIDKNETCINFWSLGNECGTGGNWKRCLEWLREQPVKKPIKDTCDYFPDSPDRLIMTGYMPMQTLYDSSPEDGHPLLLEEYAHAMGNSPGGLEDIWNWVYENEHCCGGYVWEFKSHGFYVKGKDGRPRYLYGGDFPDHYHWSNFSLDGYHTSDGTPKPSWYELKEVSAPVHVRWEKNGVTVKNTYDFKSLDGVFIDWSVKADGVSVRQGRIPLDGIRAREERFFEIPLDTAGLTGIITADCVFGDGEKTVAHKQKVLADIRKPKTEAKPFPHKTEEKNGLVKVSGDGFYLEINNGLLSKLVKNGETVFDAPMRINLWRATTDNDGIIGFEPRLAGEWERYLVHTMRFGVHCTAVADAPEKVTVRSEGKFLPYAHDWGFDTVLEYTVTAGGEVEVSVSMTPYGNDRPNVLPRVGVYFELPEGYSRCRWLGRGPGENYPDCKANAPIGVYESEVEKMNFLYDVPQETGSRQDCGKVTVFSEKTALTAEGRFAFSFHDFTLEALTKARHCDELEKSEKRYLYLDHRHRGLGSNSCGPQPEEQYELPTQAFNWTFSIKPEVLE